MKLSLRKKMLILATVSGLAVSPLAISHLDDTQIPQSYRQSYFTLMALNFGPITENVIPEPSGMSLLGLALGMSVLRRKRA